MFKVPEIIRRVVAPIVVLSGLAGEPANAQITNPSSVPAKPMSSPEQQRKELNFIASMIGVDSEFISKNFDYEVQIECLQGEPCDIHLGQTHLPNKGSLTKEVKGVVSNSQRKLHDLLSRIMNERVIGCIYKEAWTKENVAEMEGMRAEFKKTQDQIRFLNDEMADGGWGEESLRRVEWLLSRLSEYNSNTNSVWEYHLLGAEIFKLVELFFVRVEKEATMFENLPDDVKNRFQKARGNLKILKDAVGSPDPNLIASPEKMLLLNNVKLICASEDVEINRLAGEKHKKIIADNDPIFDSYNILKAELVKELELRKEERRQKLSEIKASADKAFFDLEAHNKSGGAYEKFQELLVKSRKFRGEYSRLLFADMAAGETDIEWARKKLKEKELEILSQVKNPALEKELAYDREVFLRRVLDEDTTIQGLRIIYFGADHDLKKVWEERNLTGKRRGLIRLVPKS